MTDWPGETWEMLMMTVGCIVGGVLGIIVAAWLVKL